MANVDELIKGLNNFFDPIKVDFTLIEQAADALIALQAENKSLHNELCQRCGQYREAHNGACNSCRWSKEG